MEEENVDKTLGENGMIRNSGIAVLSLMVTLC